MLSPSSIERRNHEQRSHKAKTNELAELLRNSDEHRIYLDAKTRAYGNESTRRLLDEYRILQTRVQAGTLAGADCREEMTKLQKWVSCFSSTLQRPNTCSPSMH